MPPVIKQASTGERTVKVAEWIVKTVLLGPTTKVKSWEEMDLGKEL